MGPCRDRVVPRPRSHASRICGLPDPQPAPAVRTCSCSSRLQPMPPAHTGGPCLRWATAAAAPFPRSLIHPRPNAGRISVPSRLRRPVDRTSLPRHAPPPAGDPAGRRSPRSEVPPGWKSPRLPLRALTAPFARPREPEGDAAARGRGSVVRKTAPPAGRGASSGTGRGSNTQDLSKPVLIRAIDRRHLIAGRSPGSRNRFRNGSVGASYPYI